MCIIECSSIDFKMDAGTSEINRGKKAEIECLGSIAINILNEKEQERRISENDVLTKIGEIPNDKCDIQETDEVQRNVIKAMRVSAFNKVANVMSLNDQLRPNIGQINFQNTSDVTFGNKNIYEGSVTINNVIKNKPINKTLIGSNPLDQFIQPANESIVTPIEIAIIAMNAIVLILTWDSSGSIVSSVLLLVASVLLAIRKKTVMIHPSESGKQ